MVKCKTKIAGFYKTRKIFFLTGNYTTAVIYTDTLASVSGFDILITTNLAVNPVKQALLDTLIFQEEALSIGLHNYTAAGTYRDTLSTFWVNRICFLKTAG